MSRNINLYESRYRPNCTICGNPATYRVLCYSWVSYDGFTRHKNSTTDWGCEYICRPCALVNEANRIGTPHRGSDIRYPFTKQKALGTGYTVYQLLNWPHRRARVPVDENNRWSEEER